MLLFLLYQKQHGISQVITAFFQWGKRPISYEVEKNNQNLQGIQKSLQSCSRKMEECDMQ